MKFLKRHPFATVAWFDRVVAVSFAFPLAALKPLVPEPLEIDGFDGFGFVTVSMVWTRGLRPAGFPAFLGQDFFLAGYRIFTRLREPSGRKLRGLQILRSETDRRRMVLLGNWLTHYRYRHVNVHIQQSEQTTRVQTLLTDGTPALDITFGSLAEPVALPKGSPFPDWKAARRFAGPMPFTFSREGEDSFVVIEGSRQDWVPRPVAVESWDVSLFREGPLSGTAPVLANAFVVEGVPYRWERGRVIRPGRIA